MVKYDVSVINMNLLLKNKTKFIVNGYHTKNCATK